MVENLWNDSEAKAYADDLALRVYTSNLLGRSDDLVLHGGGNTSVKSHVDGEEILYVKGSGWDLVSIKAEGFAPVKLDALKQMAALESLSDTEMVARQKAAMIDTTAPNPSVEAILHAIIPFKFVDHTHADAIVTISNSCNGEAHIHTLFEDFLIVPYVMPGFVLAQKIYAMTKEGFDWEKCGGIILHHHGIFTFDNDAKRSYEKMIEAVSRAEAFLDAHAPLMIDEIDFSEKPSVSLDSSGSRKRKRPFQGLSAPLSPSSETSVLNDTEGFFERVGVVIGRAKGYDVTLKIDQSPLARHYASQPHLTEAVTRGVLTPEHIIRTKRTPLVYDGTESFEAAVKAYMEAYRDYFDRYATDEVMLNPAPNYAVLQGFGVALFGKDEKETQVLYDIVQHTMRAVLRADKLGGYVSIDEAESFKMEYWELEQAKLKKGR